MDTPRRPDVYKRQIVAKLITRPIAALVRKLRNSDPSQPIHLEAVRIAEIDELSDAVQSLSQEVADASFRLSGIIEMAGIAIGAFEYDKETRKVYWTGQLFEVLMQDPPPKAVLSADEFERRTEGLKDCCEEISEDGSPVSYTHLDVYKRQGRRCLTGTISPWGGAPHTCMKPDRT